MSVKTLSEFYLVGGTALALQYGHRQSIDLDLFCNVKFENEKIIKALTKKFGSRFEFSNPNSKFGIFCYINKIKVDLVFYPHKLIGKPFEDSEIRFYNTNDIAAMKVQAILGRGRKKDFFDLAELLKHFTIQQIIEFHSQKYPSQQLLISIPYALTYFDEAEDSDDPVSLNGETWQSVKKKIRNAVSDYLK